MGKGPKPSPPPPPPIPPVVASNPAGEADSAVLRRKADERGMNYEDTLLAGSQSPRGLGADTLLGRRS